MKIVGNGPSLNEFDHKDVFNNNEDSASSNRAYIIYEKYNYYPNYYFCIDKAVLLNCLPHIKQLFDSPIKQFILLHCDETAELSSHEKVVLVHKNSGNEKYFGDVSTFMIYYLYKNFNIKHFNIYGCDCSYVEDCDQLNVDIQYNENDPARRIVLKPKPGSTDPNHFLPNYYDEHTEYSVPRTKNHLTMWKNISLISDIVVHFKTFSNGSVFFSIEEHLFNAKKNVYDYVSHCSFYCNELVEKKQFINIHYESSLSPNYRHVEDHILHNANKTRNECNISQYNNVVDEKILTFIICIKNRNIRTNICLVNLVQVCKEFDKQVDIILVEEKGHDLFIDKFNTFQHTNLKYIQVNEYDKNIFNRSHLLNIGIKYATTKYVAMYDCDFLTYNISSLMKTLSYYFHHNNLIFRCSLYESEAMNNKKKMHPYSYVWIYNKHIINQINYFNEDFENWGYEETDIASRILRNENKLIHIYNDFFHLSHEENTRNKDNKGNNYKLFRSNIIIPKNLRLIKHNPFHGEHILFLNYNESNEIFNDQDAIIYTPQSLTVVLINKDLFKCKIIGNITEIPFTDDVYNTFKTVNAFGFDTLPLWFKNMNNIGIITPMFNQNEDIYNIHLSSIKKQRDQNYIHITIDSFSKPNLLYKFFENNHPQSLFVQKKSKIVDAIQIGYTLICNSVHYWSWLNSDDELYDEHTLHIVKEHICKMNNPDLLYGKGIYVKENKTKSVNVCKEHERNPIESLLTHVGICQPSVYMKSKEEKIENCLFNLEENMVFDYELWIKLAFEHVQFKYIDHNLSKYNFTNINITGNNRTEQLYQTCTTVKKYYGFVPLDWIKRYSGSKLNNADGIWNMSKPSNLDTFSKEFNSDAVLYEKGDFIQNEFNKIQL
jgi:hypothetical protein